MRLGAIGMGMEPIRYLPAMIGTGVTYRYLVPIMGQCLGLTLCL